MMVSVIEALVSYGIPSVVAEALLVVVVYVVGLVSPKAASWFTSKGEKE